MPVILIAIGGRPARLGMGATIEARSYSRPGCRSGQDMQLNVLRRHAEDGRIAFLKAIGAKERLRCAERVTEPRGDGGAGRSRGPVG